MKEIKTMPAFPRLIGYRGLYGYIEEFESLQELSRDTEPLKAIQIYLESKPFLLLSHYIDHGESLDRLLNELEIPFELSDNKHAKLKGDDYSVSGMSYVDVRRNRFIFLMNSVTYNIGPDQDHLTDISPYFPGFSFEIKNLSL